MRTFFQKIYFSFLGTVVVVSIVLLVATFFIEPDRSGFRSRVLPFIAETTVSTFEVGGEQALRSSLNVMHKTRGLQTFLFDEAGTELSGREVPDSIQQAVTELKAGRGDSNPTPRVSGIRFTSHEGKTYLIVVEFGDNAPFGNPRPTPPGEPNRNFVSRLLFEGPTTIWALALVLGAGIACYGLARHLTGPLEKIRAAARDLAAGNLSSRIGPGLGQRRDEFAELAADFDRMADRIEKLVNSQRNLIRDISHELRSPLARLNLALELARNSREGELTVTLDAIERESNRLEELVDQLLTLSRLEAETGQADGREIDLFLLLQGVVQDAEFEASSRNRHVRLSGEPGCLLMASEPLLRSAFENVIRNGVQYTPESTEVEVHQRVESSAGSVKSTISVRDRGQGIPEDKIEEIFLPFRRVGEGRDRRTGGVGLGLSISKRIVEFYKGSIRGLNREEGGFEVVIQLPVIRKAP